MHVLLQIVPRHGLHEAEPRRQCVPRQSLGTRWGDLRDAH